MCLYFRGISTKRQSRYNRIMGRWYPLCISRFIDQTFNRKQMLFQVLSIFAKIMGLWVFNATYHISGILWWKVLLEKTNWRATSIFKMLSNKDFIKKRSNTIKTVMLVGTCCMGRNPIIIQFGAMAAPNFLHFQKEVSHK